MAFCQAAGEVQLREAAVPRPVGDGEVLVRVRRCGICGSDLHWYNGETPPPLVCPGHEIAGVVAAVGTGVANLSEGDRVTAEGMRTCGACAFCRAGRRQLCPGIRILGLSTPGGFADYLLTDARHLYAVPDGIDDELAQLTEPLAVGIHALHQADFQPGGRVLVLGAGSIGLLCVPAAVAAGASEIVVSARRPHQRDAALALGAHRVIDPASLRGAAVARADAGFDLVIDTVADPKTSLEDGLLAVRPGGAVVVVGVYTARASLDALRLMTHEIRLIGAMCYAGTGNRADFEVALGLLESDGEAIRREIVTHRVPFEALSEGFRLAADKTTGSVKVSVAISD
ncbi:MAG: alcohol dehydrogenase catalytic domain-containing protein [Candidatus Binatia bacterium]|nr:alcohol dehydrogenase catalytic domain-containing protein [Candidatus Binatia bacterium]